MNLFIYFFFGFIVKYSYTFNSISLVTNDYSRSIFPFLKYTEKCFSGFHQYCLAHYLKWNFKKHFSFANFIVNYKNGKCRVCMKYVCARKSNYRSFIYPPPFSLVSFDPRYTSIRGSLVWSLSRYVIWGQPDNSRIK